MDNSRLLNVNKPITLAKFLKELSLQRNAEILTTKGSLTKKVVRVYDNIGNEIYDSLDTGMLISNFELFEHLEDEVKKAYETDYDEYFLIEIHL